MLGSCEERLNMPDVRLGEVVVVVWWVVVWWWRVSRIEGEEERRRWKREGLRAGAVVTGGGEGSRRDPKRGILGGWSRVEG
jgi:hypothetical protein